MAKPGMMYEDACPVCENPPLAEMVAAWRTQGMGYRDIWNSLRATGDTTSRNTVQQHCAHVERTVTTAVAEAVDETAIEVDDDWFAAQGVDLPPSGTRWVAATVEQVGPNGEKHWLRVRPLSLDVPDERLEIRQAAPVDVIGKIECPIIVSRGKWRTFFGSPDGQLGFWQENITGIWHTTHDERYFSLGHQIAQAMASSEGLDGWIDVGDLFDLSASSRWNPTAIDLHVEGLNRTWERGAEEFARRRYAVGEEGELIVMDGNHSSIRLRAAVQANTPWLVGMKRAGSDEFEPPVLSVPFLTRSRDFGVEWCSGYPSAYRSLNSNLVVFHAPVYGSKALDTSRKLAAEIHCSVYFGHVHRREHMAHCIQTTKGQRTFETWSDGAWCRVDGSLPSQRNSYDEVGNRMLASSMPPNMGMLSESMHAGASIIHVEQGGRERFSVERIAFWDDFAQFRGVTFEATCDRDGNAIKGLAA